MSAPHTRRVFPGRSYTLVPCVGCSTPLLRDEPGNQVLGPTNWMRNCERCERRLCAVCLADDAAACVECKAALVRIELNGVLSA